MFLVVIFEAGGLQILVYDDVVVVVSVFWRGGAGGRCQRRLKRLVFITDNVFFSTCGTVFGSRL